MRANRSAKSRKRSGSMGRGDYLPIGRDGGASQGLSALSVPLLPKPQYLRQQERFASWYESPIDLPGRVYLQVVDQLFKQNQFARGEYVALGKKLSLGDVHCPAYLLAGNDDDITPWEQVFNLLKGTSARRRT